MDTVKPCAMDVTDGKQPQAKHAICHMIVGKVGWQTLILLLERSRAEYSGVYSGVRILGLRCNGRRKSVKLNNARGNPENVMNSHCLINLNRLLQRPKANTFYGVQQYRRRSGFKGF